MMRDWRISLGLTSSFGVDVHTSGNRPEVSIQVPRLSNAVIVTIMASAWAAPAFADDGASLESRLARVEQQLSQPSAREVQSSVDAYLAFVRSSASPILHILSGLAPTAAQAAWDDIREQLHAFDTPTGWEGPNELLITAARRP